MPEHAELLIVGAGPAGVSAALWARSLGIDARVLERGEQVGGQLHLVRFHPLELPGIPNADGPAIAAACAEQLRAARIPVEAGFDARGLERGEASGTGEARTPANGEPWRDAGAGTWRIAGAGGIAFESRTVVIATGLRRRRLGVPGERELEGQGVSYSARRDRETFAGAPVVVIGGGDGAFENALLLAEVGCEVDVLVRGRAAARAEFRDQVAADPRIRVVEGARVTELAGADRLEGVRYQREGRVEERAARGAVIKIGMVPNSEWCSRAARDEHGFVRVDARQRTSLTGVWAVGDLAHPLRPSIAAAIGSGATALADARTFLREG